MEERTVIAKPVACRPTVRPFSGILSGAVKASPSNSSSEPAVAAIRPKTVRVKPVVKCVPVKLVSSQGNGHGKTVSCSLDKCLQVESESTVVYKPLAKLVSKRTITLLANMEKSYLNHHQALGQTEPCLPSPNRVHYHLRPDNNLTCSSKNVPASETKTAIEPPKNMTAENSKEDNTNLPSLNTVSKPSYDGYNWRKYGQKQVKGSEYPRSYYKCTHPNCPAKKKVERLLDGQIAEIVYQGEHSHLKPLPPKLNMLEKERQGLISVATGQESNYSLSNSNLNEKNEGSEGTSDNQNETEVPSSSSNLGNGLLRRDPVKTTAIRGSSASHDDSNNGEYGENSKGVEIEDDEPTSKRRKADKQPNEARISEEGVQDPSGVVQSAADPELIGDGYRWRKYGQKVVKGNPYPRSYYRCTGPKCNVRKHVERAVDDPTAFITTYEGKHNHDMPTKNKNLVASRANSRNALSLRTDFKST